MVSFIWHESMIFKKINEEYHFGLSLLPLLSVVSSSSLFLSSS